MNSLQDELELKLDNIKRLSNKTRSRQDSIKTRFEVEEDLDSHELHNWCRQDLKALFS